MKYFKFLICVFLINFIQVYSQQQEIEHNPKFIEVSNKLTTHLIFPEEINYVDVGAPEFAIDKAKNVVKIKCIDNTWNKYDSSNVTIITKGGNYYSLFIRFNENLSVSTYHFIESDTKLSLFDSNNKKKQFKEHCEYLFHRNSNFKSKDKNQRMEFLIDGIFYEDEKIIFRTTIKNNSKITFATDSIRFWLTTRNKYTILRPFKKTKALQYTEKKATFICNNTKEVPGNSTRTVLFGFDKFIPIENEVMEVLIAENDSGGRRGKIRLKVKDFLLKD